MTADVPLIHVERLKNTPIVQRNGTAGKIALIGAFDTTETNPVLFRDLTSAYDEFGDDTVNYDGCKVLPKLFKGASSILAVNITTETTDTSGAEPVTTREKTITTAKLTSALAKIKGEDWDILFIAGILTDDFLPIITNLLDDVNEMKLSAGYMGCISESSVADNITLANLAGDYCYGLIVQRLTVDNEELDLLESSAYYTGLIASLNVGNSMTMKKVDNVTGLTPEYSFEVNKTTGDAVGDGAKLLQAGITTFRCLNRENDNYVVVNSEQPNGLDLYINRTRDYVLKEMNLLNFFGEKNRPKTLNQVIQELDRVKYRCVDTLDLLEDIKYTVEKCGPKKVKITINELLFDSVITEIDVYYYIEVQ